MDDMFKVVARNDISYLKELINSGIDMNMRDKMQRTPLMYATIDNKYDVAKELILSGAEVNIQDSLGYSALHYAAQNSKPEFAKLLLEHSAFVDLKDKKGNTPLLKAVHYSQGRGETIKILLSYGADKNVCNDKGLSPVGLAKMIANFNVLQFLE